MIEKIITAIIVFLSLYFLVKNIRRKTSMKCDCSCCTSHCKDYKGKN